MTTPAIDLSIVIPAWNEAARLPATLERIFEWADDQPRVIEVIVVDDGSTDSTAALVDSISESEPRLRGLSLGRNRGKGAAVGAGVLAATGTYILMCDADLSTPIEEIELLYAALTDADIAIGSRAVDRTKVKVHQSAHREYLGRLFNLLVQAAATPGIRDTQCGFKLFPRGAAHMIFRRRSLDRFAFDVEVLHLAQRMGYDIAEVPVLWYNDEASKVRPIRDGLQMAREVLKIRWRHRDVL